MTDVVQSGLASCGSKWCMTCAHIVTGNTFVSNISGRVYNVGCYNSILDCSGQTVIFYPVEGAGYNM